MDKRRELINKICAQEDPNAIDETSPIVSLEDFFEGNTDIGSIGCNLVDHPGISTFYKILKEIRSKDSVQDVFIEIYEVVDDDESWPYSERIYIISSSTIDEIESWLNKLEPDDIRKGWRSGTPKNSPELEKGYNVYGIWWD